MLSVVLYNGEEPWKGPTAAYDLVEPLPGLSKPADLLSFRLLDLRRISAAEIEGLASPVAALFRLEQCKVPSMLEQRIVRWTQDWERQGWKKGRKEGLREGRKKGLREGEAEVVLRQLERKHGPLPAWASERVRSADVEQLLIWTERILTAESLNEVFAD